MKGYWIGCLSKMEGKRTRDEGVLQMLVDRIERFIEEEGEEEEEEE